MNQKDYGLYDIPPDWAWTELGTITQIILGQSPPSSTYNDKSVGLPFYQGKSEFGDVYPTPRKWCSEPKKIAEKGDVLVSVRAPVGPTNICPDLSCIGRGLAALRGLCGISSQFILYLMRSFEQRLADLGTGSTFEAITGDRLRFFPIPLPPLPEQNRIVSKIEELFTKLDAGVEELKKAKAKLKRYRQAVLQAAVTGELTRHWRETCKNQIDDATGALERVLRQREDAWMGNCFPKKKSGIVNQGSKARYKMPVQPITKGMPDLPSGWVYASIDQLISEPLCNGLSIKGQEQPPGVPALRLNAMTENGFDFDQVRYLPIDIESVRSIVVRENDFFISRGNGSLVLTCVN